jgi:hypothetical protein
MVGEKNNQKVMFFFSAPDIFMRLVVVGTQTQRRWFTFPACGRAERPAATAVKNKRGGSFAWTASPPNG